MKYDEYKEDQEKIKSICMDLYLAKRRLPGADQYQIIRTVETLIDGFMILASRTQNEEYKFEAPKDL